MTGALAVLRRPAAIDAMLVVALGGVALSGFRSTFAGAGYLVAGVLGLLLGGVLALLVRRWRQPAVVLAGLVAAAYFLLGGVVALPGPGESAVLPLPGTLATLADAGIHGWKQLLTTLPPVGGGALLALPYLLGLVAGAAGTTLAVRVRLPVAPVLASAVLLALVILLGVHDPGWLAVQGCVFALLAIAWVVLRARRAGALSSGGSRLSRRLTAAGLCLAAAGVALAAGPRLPGLGDERVVLRTWVEPPFHVGQYPSPLAGFRVYTKGYQTDDPDRRLYDRELFRVTGLPEGTRVRIAALDAYDGDVWTAADDAGLADGHADTFQKVGSTIASSAEGRAVRGTVTIGEGYGGVWVPAPGALKGLRFSGPDAQQGSDAFRYNLATSTGVLPSGLHPGDRYSFTAVVPSDRLDSDTDLWAGGTSTEAAARFQSLAAGWATGGGTLLEQVLAVAAHLKNEGTYTDGESPNEQYPAGHSLRRLADFTAKGSQLAGNDEQYSALMAVLANQLGVPARVVLGAVPEGGVVRGRDVHAWVELRAADGTWRTLDWPEFMNTERKPEQQSPQPEELVEGKVVPPPVPVRPPSTTGDPLDSSAEQTATSRSEHGGGLPDWFRVLLMYAACPLLLVLLLCGLIVAAKAWRRRLRRTSLPVRRLALGWREVLDNARDFGHVAPIGGTRREQAAVLARQPGLGGVQALALATDVSMFGAEAPSEELAAACWCEVEAVRRSLAGSRGRWARLRAALSLATLVRR